MKAQIN